jgi:hypothetical protein
MEKTKHHILVCVNFRPSGEAKGKCHRKNYLIFCPVLKINSLIGSWKG